jgi:hypothetical protein
MSDWMRKVLESKRATRRRLQALSFSEKLKLLEKLRERSLVIAGSPLGRERRIEERQGRQGFDGTRSAGPGGK